MRRIATLSLAVAALAAPQAAQASDWIVTVGVRPEAVVPFEGANHDIFFPTPIFQLRRPGRPVRPLIPDDSAGLTLLKAGPLSAGPVLRFRGKRSSDGDYAGLQEVPLAIEPGVFVNLWPTNWLRLHAETRRGIRGHSGWVADGGVDLALSHGPWTATLGPRVGWGDRDYMDTYFGVTAQDAASSPFVHTTYRPGQGLRYVGVGTTLARSFGPHWTAAANFSYRQLASTAADSPIVRTLGGRDELAGGLALRYSFPWSM
jgi:outer membrane protein